MLSQATWRTDQANFRTEVLRNCNVFPKFWVQISSDWTTTLQSRYTQKS